MFNCSLLQLAAFLHTKSQVSMGKPVLQCSSAMSTGNLQPITAGRCYFPSVWTEIKLTIFRPYGQKFTVKFRYGLESQLVIL